MSEYYLMKVSKQLLGYIVVMNNLKQTWNESLLNCHLQSLLVKPTIHRTRGEESNNYTTDAVYRLFNALYF